MGPFEMHQLCSVYLVAVLLPLKRTALCLFLQAYTSYIFGRGINLIGYYMFIRVFLEYHLVHADL